MATQATQRPANGGAVLPAEHPAPELTHAIPSDGIFVVIDGGEPKRVSPATVDLISGIRTRKSKGGEAYSMGYWVNECIDNGAQAIDRSLKYAAETKVLRLLGKTLAQTPEAERGAVANKLMQELHIGSRTQ